MLFKPVLDYLVKIVFWCWATFQNVLGQLSFPIGSVPLLAELEKGHRCRSRVSLGYREPKERKGKHGRLAKRPFVELLWKKAY